VDPGIRAIIEAWAVEGGNNALDNKLTFWGGEACERIRASVDRAKLGEGDSFAVQFLKAASDDFEGFRTAFSLCPRKPSVGADGWTKVVQTLLDTWRIIFSTEGTAGGLGRKFVRYVLSSLECCQFLIYFFAVSTNS
jgi:hypothetical protein